MAGRLLQLLPPGSAPDGLKRKPLVLSGGQMEQRTQRLEVVASSMWATLGVSPWTPRATQARARPTMHPHTHSTGPKCHSSSVLRVPLARILISCIDLNTSRNRELTAQLISSWTEETAQKLPYSGLTCSLTGTFLCLQERPGQV